MSSVGCVDSRCSSSSGTTSSTRSRSTIHRRTVFLRKLWAIWFRKIIRIKWEHPKSDTTTMKIISSYSTTGSKRVSRVATRKTLEKNWPQSLRSRTSRTRTLLEIIPSIYTRNRDLNKRSVTIKRSIRELKNVRSLWLSKLRVKRFRFQKETNLRKSCLSTYIRQLLTHKLFKPYNLSSNKVWSLEKFQY